MADLSRVRGVLFDLDGTLLHTSPDIAAAGLAALNECGYPAVAPALIESFVGKGIEVLVKRLMAHQGWAGAPEPLRDAWFRHYERLNGTHADFYPTVLDSLARMQQAGLRLGVCTNKAERFTTPLLAQKNLTPFFSTVICGDTCPTKKPAPEMIYAGAAGLELEASELLMVGDSRNDAEAARAAGCPVLILPYGYNEGQSVRELDCDGIVESFKHIADLLIQA